MPEFLPLFPLNVVAYPGERLNLHIFEPRYRQLISECLEEKKHFGIPVVVAGRLPGYGTEMEITELAMEYDDGRMDIKTLGRRVFHLQDFQDNYAGKLYAGGQVIWHPEPEIQPPVLPDLMKLAKRLYQLLDQPLRAHPDMPQPYSFQIGHAVGFNPEDEYKLLTIETEIARQVFILTHLQRVIPVMEEMERTKARIRMNGSFREFGPIDLL